MREARPTPFRFVAILLALLGFAFAATGVPAPVRADGLCHPQDQGLPQSHECCLGCPAVQDWAPPSASALAVPVASFAIAGLSVGTDAACALRFPRPPARAPPV